MKGAFHGRTSLAVAATDNPNIVAPVNRTDNVIFVPLNDEAALEEAFKNNEISSVIVEAIQGVGGIRIASREFLRKIRSLCDRYNAVYIADEVQCGCGRTGQYYASDWADVHADIYTMAKGARQRVSDQGHCDCAAHCAEVGYARYDIRRQPPGMRRCDCRRRRNGRGSTDRQRPRNRRIPDGRVKKLPGVKEVRGRGLMIGIELFEDSAPLRKKFVVRREDFRRFVRKQERVPPAAGAECQKKRACRCIARRTAQVINSLMCKRC